MLYLQVQAVQKELLLDPESEDNNAWNDDSCLPANKAEAEVQKDFNLQHHRCENLKFWVT
jgi:hypothetical protein